MKYFRVARFQVAYVKVEDDSKETARLSAEAEFAQMSEEVPDSIDEISEEEYNEVME